jgi:hypothetical protein
MVQAWRLFRVHMRHKHQITKEKEKEDDEKWESKMEESSYEKIVINRERKEREKEKKRRRLEEKKTGDIPLLEFTRQVVVLTVKKHSDKDNVVTTQQEASAKLGPVTGRLSPGGKLSSAVLENVRFDSGRHLPKKTSIQGVCKECKKRSLFRCTRCNVALHAERFYNFHTPERERSEDE